MGLLSQQGPQGKQDSTGKSQGEKKKKRHRLSLGIYGSQSKVRTPRISSEIEFYHSAR